MGDLNLNEQEYQTGLSILFVGYILMQVPSNLLLNYVWCPFSMRTNPRCLLY